ncbi:U32 family peptidase [Methanobrevibacter sp. TMH8]|uniref:U32 family peptidase n=1 Tax=Methanobrevibacter sp. TMH8 TaxID=2848611 RepID=UPI001CC9AF34|nr:U32 family peptidase [Methanobrevibacter sp. TMH8]MBZ9569951.1 U32 family peptidase [Methanobrevibacter sp. TMH8]
MKETKLSLKKIGINESDCNYFSNKRFSDGAQYRFEVPGIQSPSALRSLISSCEDKNIRIHRATQTKGIMFLNDEEIEEMVSLANDSKIDLFLSVGPRAVYDTSATAQTKEGSRIGYRLRGYDNLVYAIEDVKRAIDLGVRGIVVYDEGLLWALAKMRDEKNGEIANDTKFKLSAHAGAGNPASAKLFEDIGLDSFNPVRDLSIPMIASLREAIDIPIDIHTENPKSTGGFIRHYEVPEIIKVASPVYLKTGGSIAKHHSWDTTDKEAIQRVKQVELVKNMIERYYPEAIASK